MKASDVPECLRFDKYDHWPILHDKHTKCSKMQSGRMQKENYVQMQQMPSVFVHEQEYLFPDFSWVIDICTFVVQQNKLKCFN
jgi:hypothetical protein